jgi:hemerythrin
MKKFELSDDMLTGIEVIDDQHRKLLSWGNAMASENTEAAIKVVTEALGELSLYVSYHFRAEEEAMDRYGYEMLEKHKKQHKRLILEVDKLVSRLKKEGTSRGLLIELQDQFTSWFIYHIKEWDQPFAAFLKTNNISPSFSMTEEDAEVDWARSGWA